MIDKLFYSVWLQLSDYFRIFKRPLLKEEVPNYFPEEELRIERNIPENDTDPDQYDNLEKLLMGESVHELNLDREKSRSRININASDEDMGSASA